MDGLASRLIEEFLAELAGRGCGSYTLRSYRYGLGDFARWLAGRDLQLQDVTGREVEQYIVQFAAGRAPRTVNHRLSVLGSFFEFLLDAGLVEHRPVPRSGTAGPSHGRPGGGDVPTGRRGELRRRQPRKVPRDLDPAVISQLIQATPSCRDRALLLLLSRSGARIGDWSAQHGRHGALGMELGDLDARTGTVVVRLKGARDEHRVPVSGPFWSVWDRYLLTERGDPPTSAAWVGTRRGRGQPLTYSAFEAGLRLLGRRVGVAVSAHMFRHTVATALVEHAGAAVAQQVLGHRHVATTVDTYAHLDRAVLVRAVAAFEQRPIAAVGSSGIACRESYAFHYDPATILELDAIIDGVRVVR